MRILYFDCFSGASGDMILGALIDAGLPISEVRAALGSLAITADTVWVERVIRAGVGATKFQVRGEGAPDHAHDHEHGHDRDDGHRHGHGARHDQSGRHDPSHDHDHDHDHGHGHDHGSAARHQHGAADRHRSGHSDEAHVPASSHGPHTHAHEERHHGHHRSLAEIGRLIDGSALSGEGKARAKELFHRLGEVEAGIHGTSLDRVHLHEVGALDSIIDIVGTVFALEQLRPDRIVSSPLNVGGGTVRSAHGLYPVPAPATMRLLQDVPIYSGPQRAELVTPTGALLVTGYAGEFGAIPPMRVRQIGYGAGSRDFADTPNVMRVLVGDSGDGPAHAVVVIEAEIDDMNPQIFGVLMDTLLAAGALDVFYTPIQMKKNRPGTLLTVIAPPPARERLSAAVFRETTTIGVRYREMSRECLDREVVAVDTPLGTVRFKIARRDGRVVNASPEFDDCLRLAREHGLPVKDVQLAAAKAFSDRR